MFGKLELGCAVSFLGCWVWGSGEDSSKRARLLEFFRERPLAGYVEAAEAVGTTVEYARKVLLTVIALGEATASDVSKQTGKSSLARVTT